MQLIGNDFKRVFATAIGMLALACSSLFAADNSGLVQPLPYIEVYVDSPEGLPVYRMRNAGALERIFGATIEFRGNGSQIDGDVYFGLRQPTGAVYTWNAGLGVPVLSKGMRPLARGIDVGGTYWYSMSDVFGEDIRYAFNGDEPRGLYLVFALLVVAGTSPTDTNNWIVVDMAPLLLE